MNINLRKNNSVALALSDSDNNIISDITDTPLPFKPSPSLKSEHLIYPNLADLITSEIIYEDNKLQSFS
jgi:hypothetical protein